MPTDFKLLKTAVAIQFQKMQKETLYRTEISGDALWEAYLASFPDGSDPIYRERTEHNCSACRSFIKAVGGCVTLTDGNLVSLWDIQVSEPIYQTVADTLSKLVKASPISNLFLQAESQSGIDKNFEQLLDNVKTWDHFFVKLPASAIARARNIGPELADFQATHDVMLGGLTAITPESIDKVLDLISQNSLYRGEENKQAVKEFLVVKTKFDLLTSDSEKDRFVWSHVKSLSKAISRIKNTAIGTLLTDLSEGYDLEDAVKSFESKVAPQNYKRTTALVTKDMINKAQEKIEELGLMSALSRRHAVLSDITVENILHVHRAVASKMTGNVFTEIAASLPEKTKNYDKVEEVSIEKFLADILPRAEMLEVLLENRHKPNLVSLIAPEDPTAGHLFKWNNNFSWDYQGGMADSLKERVKRAGGSVTGDLCCRLAWFNKDDLDLHMAQPQGRTIYYGNKQSVVTGGQLDVDMNASGMLVSDPVENIYYGKRSLMKEGVYTLSVNQFRQRDSKDFGFEVELDYLGDVRRFVYDKQVRGMITVAKFQYSHATGIEILESLPSTEASRTLWGLPTQTFHRVNVLMFSPNYWSGQGIGNRHYFFMLEGAIREDAARGFYNEFLKNELDPYRKAFDLVGSRMKSEGTAEQLSGLGLSSTQRNHLVVRVKGAITRTVKVIF